jgi:rare lipoprotein A
MALYIDTLHSVESLDAGVGQATDSPATAYAIVSGWGLRLLLLLALAFVFAIATNVRAETGSDAGARDPQPARSKRVARVQTGYATFLSKSFHGDESASGEIFDRRKLVAAHRSLPFGTRVRVTNLENGRSVDVRIIDRGPYGQNFREGTIIDLSRAAATRLDMVEDGQVRVKVRVLRLGDEGYRSPRARRADPS